MRKLASIQKIINIQPMEDCDNIELATVLGWNVVIAKSDNFKVGDLVVYFEIDSMIPEYMREDLSFMKDSKWRIRTKKIKNVYSAGLILPLLKVYHMYLKNNAWIPYETEQESWYKNVFNGFFGLECGNNAYEFRLELMSDMSTWDFFEGIDLTDQLGIVKYEIPDASLNNGQTKGNFIENCPRTDENRVQNFSKSDYKKLQDIDDQWVVTEKADGCLDEDTIIHTIDGDMSIKHICKNKIITKCASYDIDNGVIVYDNIINHHIEKNVDKQWYELELEDCTIIKLTGNHRIWLPELNCYRRVDKLVGDEIILTEKIDT